MEDKKYSRRDFIRKNMFMGSAVAGGVLFFGLSSLKSSAKGKSNTNGTDTTQTNPKAPATAQKPVAGAAAVDPCDDMTGVTPAELEKRKKLAYVPKAPIPDKHCGNCNLYAKPKKGKTCGSCMLFKGPVRAEGACAYWAPIVTG